MSTLERASAERAELTPKLSKSTRSKLSRALRNASPQRRESKAKFRIVRGLMLILVVAAMVGGGLYYWRYLELYPSTNDAYVSANVIKVAPQVGGDVTKAYFTPNQLVREGDPLFDIDSARHDVEIEKAYAQFDEAAALNGQGANAISAAAEELAAARKALDKARQDYWNAFSTAGAAPGETETTTHSAEVKSSQDAFQAAVDKLAAETEKIGKGSRQQTQLRIAAAAVQQAELARAETRVSAPVAGWVSGGELVAGALVQQGRPVFSIIERDNWWVEAHFRETDLGRIRPGQEASIQVDMYPDMELKGTVGSISAGSGATFSMLPPENATGNWVKVTQRFTVRLNLDRLPDDAARPLRVGASANVQVDTVGKTAQQPVAALGKVSPVSVAARNGTQ